MGQGFPVPMRVPSQEPRAKVNLGPPYPIPSLLLMRVCLLKQEEERLAEGTVYTPNQSSPPVSEELNIPNFADERTEATAEAAPGYLCLIPQLR